ncbi:MAG: bifunctional DNA-formamidopyrimidine glycosylase/DNA-(apurinic or apyrimidinic site) lyase [Candidatus Thorarchaeota archaeon]|jgi:formamidopyrimidine-DNA glycosylase
MPELPDIYVLAKSMDKAIKGKIIAGAVVKQPKCLNYSPNSFVKRIKGRRIKHVWQRGKWVISDLDNGGKIAFNQGMGGSIILLKMNEQPDSKQYRVAIQFEDGDQIWINHWWFGHVHLLPEGDFNSHKQLARLGPEPLSNEFTLDSLVNLLKKKRGRIKSYLLNQSFIAGIGNVYIQDILWHARLHPNRKANSLDVGDIKCLYKAIRLVLNKGIKYGGGTKEFDIWGTEGQFSKHLKVGYKTGKPCPKCRTQIEEIRVGSTTSYICPKCQI